MAKGAADVVEVEVNTTISGSCPEGALKIFDLLECSLSKKVYDSEPKPIRVVLEQKSKDASPGLPLRNYYSTWSDVLNHYSIEEVEEALAEAESSILEGDFPLCAFHVFSKRDRYSYKKFTERKFRTIQCGDLLLLVLLQRWLSDVKEQVEEFLPGFFTTTDRANYERRVSPLRVGYTFGIDFTAYDKNTLSPMIAAGIGLLCHLAKVPQNLERFFIETVSSSLLVVPVEENQLTLCSGGNPSGQYLTSYCNTLGHLVMNAFCYNKMFGIGPLEYLYGRSEVVRSVATGDDGLEGFLERADAVRAIEELPELLTSYFGIPAKVETLQEKPFPPNMLAPYLSRVEAKIPSGWVLLASRPNRTLGTLQWASKGDLQRPDFVENYKEQMRGIRNVLAGFEVLERLNIPTPENVRAFWRMCRRLDLEEVPRGAVDELCVR